MKSFNFRSYATPICYFLAENSGYFRVCKSEAEFTRLTHVNTPYSHPTISMCSSHRDHFIIPLLYLRCFGYSRVHERGIIHEGDYMVWSILCSLDRTEKEELSFDDFV